MTGTEFEDLYRDHAAFVRRLCRQLVTDHGQAADVEQETWLRVLRSSPPREDGLRAWVATVARNAFRQTLRSRSRRDAREKSAARETFERDYVQEREAVLDDVLAAFRNLDDRYRTVLLMRYLEDRKPGEIARQLGIPPETVRTRLKRGLEKASRALDAAYGGDRGRWRRALIAACGLPGSLATGAAAGGGAMIGSGAATATGVLAMTKVKVVFGVVIVALLLGYVAWRGDEAPQRAVDQVALAKPEGGTPRGAEDDSSDEAIVPAPFVREDTTSGPGEKAGRKMPSPARRLVELRGRLLLPDGKPAVGAALNLHGWSRNQDAEARHGKPEWDDVEAASGPDGRYRVRFETHPALQFMMNATLAGCSRLSWRWSEFRPGMSHDLGDSRFAAAATISGRIVDEDGRPVPGKWRVSADVRQGVLGAGREGARAFGKVDRATGEFRIDGVAPGIAELRLRSDLVHRLRETVETRAGEVSEVVVVYRGPDVRRRISVSASTSPFHIFRVRASSVHLEQGGRRIATAIHLSGSASRFVFDDLEPGLYDVVIEDERFRRWVKAGVEPGEGLVARLVGSVTVQLAVTDEKGRAIEGYDATVSFVDSNTTPSTFPLQEAGRPLPGDGRFEGLLPGRVVFEVGAPGLSRKRTEPLLLAAGAVHDVAVTLTRGNAVTGVIRGSGIELAERRVELRRDLTNAEEGTVSRERVTQADARGAFRFDAVPDGRWRVVVTVNSLLTASSEPFEVSDGGSEPVELALGDAGHFVGRVDAGGKPVTLERLSLRIMRSGFRSITAHGRGILNIPVREDGAFGPVSLPAGPEFTVFLVTESGARTPVLERLRLAPGENAARTLSLADVLPARVTVVATVRGVPPQTVVATLSREGHPGAVTGPLDERGRAVLEGVLPGTYTLTLGSTGRAWSQKIPGLVTVLPGRDVEVAASCDVVSGDLDVDLDGIHLGSYGGLEAVDETGTRRGWFQVNAAGRARIVLPRGRYTLSFRPAFLVSPAPAHQSGGTPFDWPRPAGVAEAVSFGR